MMTRKLSVQVDAMIAPSEKIEHILNGYQVSCPVDVVPSGIDTEKYKKRIGDGKQGSTSRKIWNRERRNGSGICRTNGQRERALKNCFGIKKVYKTM